MGFSSFLQGFIPKRWLDTKLPGNVRLFNGLGATLDWINDLLQQVKRESRVLTAIETIPIREKEHGMSPDPSIPIDVRRASIIARQREQSRPLTKADLKTSLQSYGVVVDITNDPANSTMTFKILNVNGVPVGYQQVQEYLRQAVRAHVEVIFMFRYIMISEIEALTISQVEALTLDQIAWG